MISQTVSQGRLLIRPTGIMYHLFLWSIGTPTAGTCALMQYSPLLFNAPSDFTNAFVYFAMKMQKIGFPNNSDTETLKEFRE